MDVEQLKELAYIHLANRKAHLEREKGFIYYHGQRVAKIAVWLREFILPHDQSHDEILMAAAFFHDIAKGIEPHSYYGSILVEQILRDYCSGYELEQITELIRWHQFRDQTKDYSEYIKILQDADTLDHGGSVELWMNFQYQSHTNGTLLDSVQFYREEYDKIAVMMRQGLNYDISVQIFDEKVEFVRNFIERMSVEAEGRIFGFD